MVIVKMFWMLLILRFGLLLIYENYVYGFEIIYDW